MARNYGMLSGMAGGLSKLGQMFGGGGTIRQQAAQAMDGQLHHNDLFDAQAEAARAEAALRNAEAKAKGYAYTPEAAQEFLLSTPGATKTLVDAFNYGKQTGRSVWEDQSSNMEGPQQAVQVPNISPSLMDAFNSQNQALAARRLGGGGDAHNVSQAVKEFQAIDAERAGDAYFGSSGKITSNNAPVRGAAGGYTGPVKKMGVPFLPSGQQSPLIRTADDGAGGLLNAAFSGDKPDGYWSDFSTDPNAAGDVALDPGGMLKVANEAKSKGVPPAQSGNAKVVPSSDFIEQTRAWTDSVMNDPAAPVAARAKAVQMRAAAEKLAQSMDPGSKVVQRKDGAFFSVGRDGSLKQLSQPVHAGPETVINNNIDTSFLKPEKAAINEVDKELLKAQAGITAINQTAKTFKPEYLQLGTRVKMEMYKAQAKLGLLAPENEKKLTDFANFKKETWSNLNEHLKAFGGTAVTQSEMERLLNDLPNPGTGVFDGDDAVTFKAKMDATVRQMHRIEKRLALTKRYGFAISEVPLDQVDEIADRYSKILPTRAGGSAGNALTKAFPIAPAAKAPVKIKTEDDFRRLPSGTEFIDPNGVKRKKP